jgi:hypothetical protein
MSLAIMRAGLTAGDWVKHPYGGQCPRCDRLFDELWGSRSLPGPGTMCWECGMCWDQSEEDKEEEKAAKYRGACLAAGKAATNATEAAAGPGVVVPSTPGVAVDPQRRRPQLGHPLDPRMPQALSDEIRDHLALAMVPDTPLGHPPSQPAVIPLHRRPRLGMLRARWQFVGLKRQLMSVNDTRRKGARAVKKTFEVVKIWKRRSPGPGGCREYKRVVVTQVQTTYTLAHDLSHGGICTDLVKFLPHMKARHPLHTLLVLRATCRQMIPPCVSAMAHRINFLRRLSRHRRIMLSVQQTSQLSRIIDSGFLFQSWLPSLPGTDKWRHELKRQGLLSDGMIPYRPLGMTHEYWVKLQERFVQCSIVDYGWIDDKLIL